MRVLVACEFSGTVRRAFRDKGDDAWSCDLLPADDGGPHFQGNILDVLEHETDWDMMIAFPPCTHLAVSGAKWFKDKKVEQEASLEFVRTLLAAPIPRIALENPVGIISTRIRKPDQIIQPYEFGHDASKRTCLWLKGLPLLRPTQIVAPRLINGKKIWGNQTPSGQNKLGPSPDRWKLRSITYEGIARAMAKQWR
jgi:hypothetical protein